MVTSPTRDQSILNIFTTNCPELVIHVEVILGRVDHDVIITESSIIAKHIKDSKCTIYLWDQADPTKLQEVATSVSDKVCSAMRSD